MAEVKLSLVDENYKPPEKPSNAEVLQAHQAAGIREGLRRGREKLADQWKLANDALTASAERVADMKEAHARHIKATAKANWHQGGLFVGAVAFAAGMFMAAALLTNGFSMGVARDRIPRASVPTITDNYQEPEYDRARLEPGDAQ